MMKYQIATAAALAIGMASPAMAQDMAAPGAGDVAPPVTQDVAPTPDNTMPDATTYEAPLDQPQTDDTVADHANPDAHSDRAVPPATASAGVAAGTQVYGADGAVIGTVTQVEGDVVLLNVDERAIPVPASAIADGATGPTINITRTDLVSQFDEQMGAMDAQLDAALVEGAAVQTADGQPLGTIQSMEADAIVIAGTEGEMTLSKPMLAIGPQGSLIVRATMEQIQQAMAQAPAEG